MPHPSLDSFFFWNSGSEAVEAAIKLARTATGRQNIITMQGKHQLLVYMRIYYNVQQADIMGEHLVPWP